MLTSTGVWRGFNLIPLLLVEDDSYMSSDRILPWSGLFEISHDTGEFIMLSSGPCSLNNRFVFALHFFPSHSIKIRFGIILVGKREMKSMEMRLRRRVLVFTSNLNWFYFFNHNLDSWWLQQITEVKRQRISLQSIETPKINVSVKTK